jgi:DNA-binding MarR family transcriptional regulator
MTDADIRKDECFATAVRKASRRLTQLYDDALVPSGLRSTQFSILAKLATLPAPPTLMQLAEAMVSDRSSLGHALRPLVRDGYVALRRGDTDRRTQHIVLTDLGHARFRDGLALWQAAQRRFVSHYGEEWSGSLRAAVLRIAHDDRLGAIARGEPGNPS